MKTKKIRVSKIDYDILNELVELGYEVTVFQEKKNRKPYANYHYERPVNPNLKPLKPLKVELRYPEKEDGRDLKACKKQHALED